MAEENPAIVRQKVPDATTFNNFWFVLARFLSGLPEDQQDSNSMPSEFETVIQDLINIFNNNPRWS